MTAHEHQATAPANAPIKADELPSATISSVQRRDITVRFQYLENDPLYDSTKPVQVTPPFPPSSRTNVRLTPGPDEVLNDVRGREDQFTLDNNGFCYVHAPTKFKNWSSQPSIAKDFLPEMEELLKREVDGCDEIVFYDARIRQESDEGVRVQGLSFNPYARQVHVDNTETSVIEKIRSITEMKADYHLKGRSRIINIWRPIKHPVYDCGLAIADGGKLREGDVMECDRQRQDTGEYWDTMGVIKFRPGFDWWYMSLQDEPDVLLFKNYDSATDVQAKLCLHTAFDLPPEEVAPNAPTRESIEVRALIFTHPQGARRPSWSSTPHPLALHLEQNNLKLINDERNITDRIRTDIDEGKEIKDAVLLDRRRRIRELESLRDGLIAGRNDLRHELEQARAQISIQTAHAEALQTKVEFLEQQLARQNGDLLKHIETLSKEVTDARLYEHTRSRDERNGHVHASGKPRMLDQDPEIVLLLERIEHQQLDIEKWKGEAMGSGNEAVSRSWQASVDEAVRMEREKDSFVIKSLRDEIERLKAERDTFHS